MNAHFLDVFENNERRGQAFSLLCLAFNDAQKQEFLTLIKDLCFC